MTRNFFGSRHGKGEHDGIGTILKMGLTHEQLKRDDVVLRKANDVVDLLTKTMSTVHRVGVYTVH